MEVTITDVTSLGGNKVCIAGDADGRTIRLSDPTPSESWTRQQGLMPGVVVDLDWSAKRNLRRPHIEDGEWVSASCKVVRRVAESQLADFLSGQAVPSVRDVFGPSWFVGKNGNGAFRPGRGERSLATIEAKAVFIGVSFDKPRIRFIDAADDWREVPLQDLAVRLHLRDCSACQRRAESLLQSEFQGAPAILRVGLARQWQAGNYEPACWLQVNHVFLLPPRRDHFTYRSSP